MSIYGLELIAPSGNSFILPDSNPFTFHTKHIMYASGVAGGIVQMDTGIPSYVRTLFFWQNVTTGPGTWDTEAVVLVVGGTYHLRAQTGNVIPGEYFAVYSFTDRIIKDVSGGATHGIQIFDASGNLAFGNESKPLKMYIDQTPPFGDYVHQYQYPTSFPSAFLVSALTNYTPRNNNPTYYTSPMGIYAPGQFIGAQIMSIMTGVKLFPNGTENWSYTRSLCYINTTMYD